ncbi:MAG: response regulator [Nitrososphaeraceae archaeon]|jgi:DNA-binding NtrC family response regulator
MRGTDIEADSRPFILALDDDFDVINIFRLGLEKYGLNVFGFTDPLLALEHFKINRERYAIVVSDIRMPTMNGYEFVKKVKEMKPEVKIFLMTAFEINDLEFSRALPSIRIDEFIQKPVSVGNLVVTIQKYISELKIS